MRNSTLLDIVHSMIKYSSVPTSFWGYVIQTAIYILNNVQYKFVPKTIYEQWNSHKSNLCHLRIWRYFVHVLKNKIDKMKLCSKVHIFVCYSKGKIDGFFYNPKDIRYFLVQIQPF